MVEHTNNCLLYQGDDRMFYSQKDEILSFKSYAGMQRSTDEIINDAAAQMNMNKEESLEHIRTLKNEACLNEQGLKDVTDDFME